MVHALYYKSKQLIQFYWVVSDYSHGIMVRNGRCSNLVTSVVELPLIEMIQIGGLI